ncbi:MAG: hypothetical protein A4S14_18325 [Proteobacteria bacterium SG_bin9]|nr:MAG: hypothetical protein A4S14_18325 [Proteobacteria bacterium SG_bin9]
MLRNLTRSGWFLHSAGVLAAEFLRLVWLTNRFTYDPPDLYDRVEREMPAIFAFWHGHHFMMSFAKKRHHRAKVLISRHRDGEINAVAARRLGADAIRGSGDHGNEFRRKGGVSAFMSMLRALKEENCSIAVTADVPKVARIAGLGVIMLARESGRPIIPVAIATSRFKRLDNWDRSVVHLPFGRGIIMAGDVISVPSDADDQVMEACRVQLETSLNELTRRAYARIGRPGEA